MEIKTIDDISNISRKITKNVQFKLSFLSEKENEVWEKKFNAFLSECGCSTGQRFLLFLFPLIAVITVILFIFSSKSFITILSFFIVALVISGAIGKITGLRRRNRNIKELIVSFYKENELLIN